MDISKDVAKLIALEMVKADVVELSKQEDDDVDLEKRMGIDPDEVTSKDRMRIDDIIRHANDKYPDGGSQREQHERHVAMQMAAKITDPYKAYRRGRYAENENYHHIAGEYYARAAALGHPKGALKGQGKVSSHKNLFD
jgi:hypothetical protein